MPWLFLAIAIAAEVWGTLGLRAISESRTWWAIVLIVISYTGSFAALTVSLRHLNVGVVYAIWSATGVAAISYAGYLLFDEKLGEQAVVGMSIIVLGVVILVTSGSARHW